MNPRDELISYISDGHKDAYGFRPRHYDFEAMDIVALQVEADRIAEAVLTSIEEEAAAQRDAAAKFEAEIATSLKHGAADRATAIRWALDARGLLDEPDAGYICYRLGLSYDCAAMFKGVTA